MIHVTVGAHKVSFTFGERLRATFVAIVVAGAIFNNVDMSVRASHLERSIQTRVRAGWHAKQNSDGANSADQGRKEMSS